MIYTRGRVQPLTRTPHPPTGTLHANTHTFTHKHPKADLLTIRYSIHKHTCTMMSRKYDTVIGLYTYTRIQCSACRHLRFHMIRLRFARNTYIRRTVDDNWSILVLLPPNTHDTFQQKTFSFN